MPTKTMQNVRPGERTSGDGKPIGNKILLSISDREFRLLRHRLEFVSLPQHLILHDPHRKLEFVYFPNDGMVSLVVATADGRAVEVGLLGNEGITGTASTVGLPRSPVREVVQIAGDGFRMGAGALRNLLNAVPKFQVKLNRYVVLLGLQMAQTAACNRLHKVEQRLARWLLTTQDRVDAGDFSITHDFLATMLGTDRPSLSLAAAALKRNCLIEYSRRTVTILNRKNLENWSCECYRAVRDFNGHLGLK